MSPAPLPKVGYDQARADFEWLEKNYGELDDQVAVMSYMTQFMQNPTKAFAAKLYCICVRLWFHEHGTEPRGMRDAKVYVIAYRHGCR